MTAIIKFMKTMFNISTATNQIIQETIINKKDVYSWNESTKKSPVDVLNEIKKYPALPMLS
jgi:hypothetical protein